MSKKIKSPSLDSKFCFEIFNTEINLKNCIELVNQTDWFSYENFDKKYEGYHGIGLTGFENSANIELDSLTIYQEISRKTDNDKSEINWQNMSARTKNVKGFMIDFFDNLKFKPQRARFSKIDPGKSISLHRDDYMENMTRVHWPVISSPENIMFNYDEENKKIDRYYLEPGRCYAINTNLLHGIKNNSNISRVHLIINFSVPFEKMKEYSSKGLLHEKI